VSPEAAEDGVDERGVGRWPGAYHGVGDASRTRSRNLASALERVVGTGFETGAVEVGHIGVV
jgi:hypothetical protein